LFIAGNVYSKFIGSKYHEVKKKERICFSHKYNLPPLLTLLSLAIVSLQRTIRIIAQSREGNNLCLVSRTPVYPIKTHSTQHVAYISGVLFSVTSSSFFFFWTDNSFLFFFKFYFIFKFYIIVLVLPNIKMNLPQVYICSPSWTLLPPPSPYHPSGSSQCTSPKHPVSCIEPSSRVPEVNRSLPFSPGRPTRAYLFLLVLSDLCNFPLTPPIGTLTRNNIHPQLLVQTCKCW